MLIPYEGNQAQVLTEDGYEYRRTFWVRYVDREGKVLIYGKRFYDMQEADEFTQSFDWSTFDSNDWTE